MSDTDNTTTDDNDDRPYRPAHAIGDCFDYPLTDTTETAIDLTVHTHVDNIDIHNPHARNTMSAKVRDLLTTRWVQRSNALSPDPRGAGIDAGPLGIYFHVSTWEINRRTGAVELHVAIEPEHDPATTAEALLIELRIAIDELTEAGFTTAVNVITDHLPSSMRLSTVLTSEATFHTLRPTPKPQDEPIDDDIAAELS